MQLRRRTKDVEEKTSIKSRKIKKKKIPKEIPIKIKKRNPKTVILNKKKICNRHSETKIIYTKTECPLCDSNRLVSSLTDTIDMQRKIIKKGFDVVWQKIELDSEKKEEKEEKIFHKLNPIKRKKRNGNNNIIKVRKRRRE